MGALPPPETPSMSARFGEEEGRGRRELALNLPDIGELVVSNAGELLAGTLAAGAGMVRRVRAVARKCWESVV